MYVLGDQNAIQYRPVTIGQLDDGLRVVEKGLTADDWVVTGDLQKKLRPGTVIKPERLPMPMPPASIQQTPWPATGWPR